MRATDGKVLFQTVREAFGKAGIQYNEEDDSAILVWNDTLKDMDYFSSLKPFQIVNRVPEINLICRKAPFVRIIQRVSAIFPELYTFLPRSFILPLQNALFSQETGKHERKFIVKPDNGSLGKGITIIEPNMVYTPTQVLSIAQEYIDSRLIRDTKFDLRVYVLIASISPLKIYVYRDGIARFCSEVATSTEGVFGSITNTAVNRKNPDVKDINSITQRISHVFEELRAGGADIDKLWQKIDQAAVLTVLAVFNFISKTSHSSIPFLGIPRCFQILGFDVLLDKELNPWILEVNYRPSLEFDTEDERQLKVEMLSSAMSIAAPFSELQAAVSSKTGAWNENMWRSFLEHNPEAVEACKKKASAAAKASKFAKAYPTKLPINDGYDRVMAAVKQMPMRMVAAYRMPDIIDAASKRRMQNQCGVKAALITKPVAKRSLSPGRKKVPVGTIPF